MSQKDLTPPPSSSSGQQPAAVQKTLNAQQIARETDGHETAAFNLQTLRLPLNFRAGTISLQALPLHQHNVPLQLQAVPLRPQATPLDHQGVRFATRVVPLRPQATPLNHQGVRFATGVMPHRPTVVSLGNHVVAFNQTLLPASPAVSSPSGTSGSSPVATNPASSTSTLQSRYLTTILCCVSAVFSWSAYLCLSWRSLLFYRLFSPYPSWNPGLMQITAQTPSPVRKVKVFDAIQRKSTPKKVLMNRVILALFSTCTVVRVRIDNQLFSSKSTG